MSVMSIRVDEEKKRKLKAIASMQGKTMSSIIEKLIDEYIAEYYNSNEELKSIMKVSEPSFDEWDNDEDDVYDNL